jgi:hypothetical protein
METRSKYTKVSCEVGLSVDGRELPSMEVLGKALEEATELIQQRVTESYQVVPARVPDTTNVPLAPTPVQPLKSEVPALTNDNPGVPVQVPAQGTDNTETIEVLEPVPFGKPWDIGR